MRPPGSASYDSHKGSTVPTSGAIRGPVVPGPGRADTRILGRRLRFPSPASTIITSGEGQENGRLSRWGVRFAFRPESQDTVTPTQYTSRQRDERPSRRFRMGATAPEDRSSLLPGPPEKWDEDETPCCDACGYPAPLTEYPESIPLYEHPDGRSWRFCTVCAHTMVGSAMKHPNQYGGERRVMQMVAWGINYLRDFVTAGAAIVGPTDEDIQRQIDELGGLLWKDTP